MDCRVRGWCLIIHNHTNQSANQSKHQHNQNQSNQPAGRRGPCRPPPCCRWRPSRASKGRWRPQDTHRKLRLGVWIERVGAEWSGAGSWFGCAPVRLAAVVRSSGCDERSAKGRASAAAAAAHTYLPAAIGGTRLSQGAGPPRRGGAAGAAPYRTRCRRAERGVMMPSRACCARCGLGAGLALGGMHACSSMGMQGWVHQATQSPNENAQGIGGVTIVGSGVKRPTFQAVVAARQIAVMRPPLPPIACCAAFRWLGWT